MQATDPLGAIERQLEQIFSQYDHEGAGLISGEHLSTVMAALPQWNLPDVEELRPQLDPDSTSMLVWDRFEEFTGIGGCRGSPTQHACEGRHITLCRLMGHAVQQLNALWQVSTSDAPTALRGRAPSQTRGGRRLS